MENEDLLSHLEESLTFIDEGCKSGAVFVHWYVQLQDSAFHRPRLGGGCVRNSRSYQLGGKTIFLQVQGSDTSRKHLCTSIEHKHAVDIILMVLRVTDQFWKIVKIKTHLRSNNLILLSIHLQLRWQIQKCNCCDCVSDEKVRHVVRGYHENGQ